MSILRPLRRRAYLAAMASLALSIGCSNNKKAEAPSEAPTTATADSTQAPAEEFDLPALPTDLNATLPLDARITKGTLDNGLTYYILANSQPEKRAEFWMSINAGSFQEDEDQLGLAHFLEHMAFNGTKSFPKNELIAKLEGLGVDFGAHLNAQTGFDDTIYKLRLPTDNAENVDLGLQILAEWIDGITLDPEEFEKERGVVLAEKRSGDGPAQRLMTDLIGNVLEGTRYANRLPIGKPEILKKAPLAAIQRYYHDWYHPANAAVYVVGDVDVAEIETKIKERFGAIAAREDARVAPKRNQPKAEGFKFLSMQDAELPLTAVAFGRFQPAADDSTMKGFREFYINMVASTMLAARLEEAQKKGKASFMGAAAQKVPLLRETDIFAAFAMLNPKEITSGTEALLDELERARRHGFNKSELDRANEQLLSGMRSGVRDYVSGKQNSGELVAELTRHHLTGEPMSGRLMELALMKQFASDVTVDETKAVFEGFFDVNGLVAASIGSAKAADKGELSEDNLRAMIEALPKKSLPPYADAPVVKDLLKAAPKPGTIVSKSHDKDLDLHEWKLSNGATVVVKKTDFKDDQVLFRAASFGGLREVADKDLIPVLQVDELLHAGGLGSFDATALEKALAGRDVGLSSYIDANGEGVSGHAGKDDLEALLQLNYLTFTAPRADAEAVAVYKKNQKSQLEQAEKTPEVKFNHALAPLVANKDPRQLVMTSKLVDKLDLDTSLKLYKERMANAGDFTFFIVGAVELDKLETLAQTYLASLPDAGARETRSYREWPHAAKREYLEMREGSQDRAALSLRYITHFPAGLPSLKERLAYEVFAKGATMRFLEIFREELGESYGAYVGSNASPVEMSLSAFVQSSPKSAKKVLTQAEKEMARLAVEGITEEHFKNAKESMLKNYQVDIKTNGHWISALQYAFYTGADRKNIVKMAEAVESLTQEDVRETVAKYLDTKRPVVGLLLPKKVGK